MPLTFVCQLQMKRLTVLAWLAMVPTEHFSARIHGPVAKQRSDRQIPEPFSAISTLTQLDFPHPTPYFMENVVSGWATPGILCRAPPPSLHS